MICVLGIVHTGRLRALGAAGVAGTDGCGGSVLAPGTASSAFVWHRSVAPMEHEFAREFAKK